MEMKRIITAIVALLVMSTAANADDEIPTIDPIGYATSTEEGEQSGKSFSGSAPLVVSFKANAQNTAGWNAYYEWRFTLTDLQGREEETPYLIRYEEDTEVTFTRAGMHKVELYAVFTQGTDTVPYTEEYWQDAEKLTVSISESHLEMPNAFSPNNGDDINNIYGAKSNYKSIVEFHGYIFNRWGQKLYEWHDPAGGWDGKYKGKDVAQGVYYCLVKAKGADGRVYNFHTDVNLLRGFTEDTGVNNME